MTDTDPTPSDGTEVCIRCGVTRFAHPVNVAGAICGGMYLEGDTDWSRLKATPNRLDRERDMRSVVFSTVINFFGFDEADPDEQATASEFTRAVLVALGEYLDSH